MSDVIEQINMKEILKEVRALRQNIEHFKEWIEERENKKKVIEYLGRSKFNVRIGFSEKRKIFLIVINCMNTYFSLKNIDFFIDGKMIPKSDLAFQDSDSRYCHQVKDDGTFKYETRSIHWNSACFPFAGMFATKSWEETLVCCRIIDKKWIEKIVNADHVAAKIGFTFYQYEDMFGYPPDAVYEFETHDTRGHLADFYFDSILDEDNLLQDH